MTENEYAPADPALLASANRMLSERLAGVAHALRGSGLSALANIGDGEDLQQHAAALAGAYQMALDDRDNLMALVEVLKRNLDSKSHECGSLREQVAKHPSTGGDVIGYYVIEKSMPDCDTLDVAIQTATAYIHDGAAKCEIIAACRVGAVERKAEWVPA